MAVCAERDAHALFEKEIGGHMAVSKIALRSRTGADNGARTRKASRFFRRDVYAMNACEALSEQPFRLKQLNGRAMMFRETRRYFGGLFCYVHVKGHLFL